MNTTSEVTIGPFFTPDYCTQVVGSRAVPLNLSMEWSSPDRAKRIPLFRNYSPFAPDRIRLEQIVFRHLDLPSDLECQEDQVVCEAGGTFLPLGALLLKLYRDRRISRSIFQVLNDLAAVVRLHNPVTNPITSLGLLVPKAEARGFRLNSVFHDSGVIHAQVGWQADGCLTRFHVGMAVFQATTHGESNPGKWVAPAEAGVCQILSDELLRLEFRTPFELFSAAGIQTLTADLPASSVSHA
jgi:hypothetical protein